MKIHKHLFIIALALLTQISIFASPKLGDTIQAPRILQTPIIDGLSTDACWDSATWNPMPYVWIPYGTVVPAADFTGRFKTVWNEEKNLMYFLFEITDDKFVNGYIFSSSNGNYWMYDVVEIFIDEDKSGGTHETTNNAFAYHITGGNTNTDYDAADMWSTIKVNYKDHFPEFSRVKNGNVYTWEFSMIILNKDYTPTSVINDFRPQLTVNKKMGFAAAYCDDDQSTAAPQRDNFIASKYQTQANSNESYKNASVFGLLQLVEGPTTTANSIPETDFIKAGKLDISPNPIMDFAELSFNNNYKGSVEIVVYNAIGQVVSKDDYIKTQAEFKHQLNFINYNSGLYIVSIRAGNNKFFSKVLK